MILALLLAMTTPYYVPVCGHPFIEYTVGDQNADGTYTGRLYESASCSTGGRGSHPRRYAVCEAMTWDAGGVVISHDLIWSDTGLTVRQPAECFAP